MHELHPTGDDFDFRDHNPELFSFPPSTSNRTEPRPFFQSLPDSPAAIKAACEGIRKRLASEEENGFIVWRAPEILRELWVAMEAVGGPVPLRPKWLHTAKTGTQFVGTIKDNPNEVKGFVAESRIRDAVSIVVGWCEDRVAKAAEVLGKEAESRVDNVAEPRSAAQSPTRSKREQRAKWLAEAMLLVRDRPDWSDAEIARQVGKHPSTLARSKEFKSAAALARGDKTDRLQGNITVDSDSGLRDVEAVAPAAVQPDEKADRGQPVAGSRYVREYCAECGEPMKVKPDQVGTNPVCKDCKP